MYSRRNVKKFFWDMTRSNQRSAAGCLPAWLAWIMLALAALACWLLN